MAERYVQIAKNLLRKCLKDGTDIQLALLNLRNVPRNDDLKSPVERLMSRSTRTTLPMHKDYLQPKLVNKVTSNIKHLRGIQKKYADRGVKEGSTFRENDQVKIRIGHRDWAGAKILEKSDKPRSYILERPNGKPLRRNTSQIRPTLANLNSESSKAVDVDVQSSNPVGTTQSPINRNGSDEVFPSRVTAENSGSAMYVTKSGRILKPVDRLNL